MWEDPWLPRGFTRRPITPRCGTLLSRVADLIHPATGQWDEVLIKYIFWPEDVPVILALPVHIDMEDILAWHSDPIGLFSVKCMHTGCSMMISN